MGHDDAGEIMVAVQDVVQEQASDGGIFTLSLLAEDELAVAVARMAQGTKVALVMQTRVGGDLHAPAGHYVVDLHSEVSTPKAPVLCEC